MGYLVIWYPPIQASFLLEDDLILSQIADMAEDDTDQIMCSQVQTLETQYWNDIELSQTVSEMLSGLPASPDVNLT